MAAETVQINAQDFTSQTYKTQDANLISSFSVGTLLSASSYIESFIYDNSKNILSSNYNFTQYTVLADGQSAGLENSISTIQLDPESILVNEGYSQGIYNTYFNFLNRQVGSNLQQLYISEISSDRTEIRLDSTSLTNEDIVEQANSLTGISVSSTNLKIYGNTFFSSSLNVRTVKRSIQSFMIFSGISTDSCSVKDSAKVL